MSYLKKERRKYERYETQAQIYFHVNYNVKTKLRFQLADAKKDKPLPKKYPAQSKNISVEGLGFSCDKRLNKGDILYLEAYLPGQKESVRMTGEARWSHLIPLKDRGKYKFDTGIRLLTVSGEPVPKTIYYDQKNQIFWSSVLESILGNFRKLVGKMRLKSKKAKIDIRDKMSCHF